MPDAVNRELMGTPRLPRYHAARDAAFKKPGRYHGAYEFYGLVVLDSADRFRPSRCGGCLVESLPLIERRRS